MALGEPDHSASDINMSGRSSNCRQKPETSDPLPSTSVQTKPRVRHFIMKTDRVPANERPVFPRFGFPTSQITTKSETNSLPGASTSNQESRRVTTIPGQGPMTVPIPTDGSFWQTPHVADPCTVGGLLHTLACGHGHKIVTTEQEPQPCALNCLQRKEPDLAQPRDIGQSYLCMACIVDHLKQRHENRFADYYAELQAAAEESEKSSEWIEEKLDAVSKSWQDQDVEEVKILARGKKTCTALWVEPEYQSIVDRALMEQQTGRKLPGMGSRAPSPTPNRTQSRISTLRGSVYEAFKRPSRQVSTSTTDTKLTRQTSAGTYDDPKSPVSTIPSSPPSPTASSVYSQNIPLWLSPGSPDINLNSSPNYKPLPK